MIDHNIIDKEYIYFLQHSDTIITTTQNIDIIFFVNLSSRHFLLCIQAHIAAHL